MWEVLSAGLSGPQEDFKGPHIWKRERGPTGRAELNINNPKCHSGKPHSPFPSTEAVQVSVDTVFIVRIIFRENVHTLLRPAESTCSPSDPLIHPIIHPSTHPFIHRLPVCSFTVPSIRLSSLLLLHTFIHLPSRPSIFLPIHLTSHSSTYPPSYSSTHLYIAYPIPPSTLSPVHPAPLPIGHAEPQAGS